MNSDILYIGMTGILENCRLHFTKETCPWIFIASTSHVYSLLSLEEQFINETLPLNPISIYGLTKAQADE
ncbi:unnamed protein product [Adineta steineri]|uniref:NAD(P)-binding domain-containing protein n=1 Tax=Adineta steineri TaxID=433720 RepID=A0A819CRT4_9BILA|nr:unnamed protein product [Adineta steineri]CAF3822749.1 unnamed protein product [Adineta steineri]